ncbi:MAG: methylenetetrahydrofolate reductase [NAD(P)H] [Bacteroidales bacterium]|nr:methylenetetrahydrofolate reductase [NAD(P)H] [Bacteroidales bacterium]
MNIVDLIKDNRQTAFTFEIVPPLKGAGLDHLCDTIELLREFDPKYINITSHRSEQQMVPLGSGLFRASSLRRRPGTVAVAAALKARYHIPMVPHMLCGGFSREETEYALLDLQFLDISNLLVLRGDKARHDDVFRPAEEGHAHATELIEQINRFNEGYFDDGSKIKHTGQPFSYGVACYPEKHEEAPNAESDFYWFKRKIELGASYGVTQLFFDNQKYFDFVAKARAAGINVPIIPGIKPIRKMHHLSMLPETFNCTLPEPLAEALRQCKSDTEAEEVGIAWAVQQCKELIAAGVPSLHFYAINARHSIRAIAEQIY